MTVAGLTLLLKRWEPLGRQALHAFVLDPALHLAMPIKACQVLPAITE